MARETSKSAVAEEEFRVPPYFDRYQEEREKRYQSELHRVEEGVQRNGERIGELGKEMDRRFTELKEEMDRRFTELKEEMDRRFEGVDRRFEGVDRRFTELKEEMNRRFDQQGTWIKFTFGILSTGMVAILVKLFVG